MGFKVVFFFKLGEVIACLYTGGNDPAERHFICNNRREGSRKVRKYAGAACGSSL